MNRRLLSDTRGLTSAEWLIIMFLLLGGEEPETRTIVVQE